MHVRRKVPTYVVVRTTCRQSREVLRIIQEFRPDTSPIDGTAIAEPNVTVFYVSPVPLREITRLGKRERRCFARLATPAVLIEELGEDQVPMEVRRAHSCVALRPLTATELQSREILARLRDSLRETCRLIRIQAQQADARALADKAAARKMMHRQKRTEHLASNPTVEHYGRSALHHTPT